MFAIRCSGGQCRSIICGIMDHEDPDGRRLFFFWIAQIWLYLAGSTAYVVETLRQQTNQIRSALRVILGLSGIAAVLSAFGCTEAYFREHPGNNFIFPRYGRTDLGGIDVWLDIGLFTDPIYRWPLARIVIIFSIGCAAYTAICLLYDLARWRIRSRTTMGKAEEICAQGHDPKSAEGVFAGHLTRV